MGPFSNNPNNPKGNPEECGDAHRPSMVAAPCTVGSAKGSSQGVFKGSWHRPSLQPWHPVVSCSPSLQPVTTDGPTEWAGDLTRVIHQWGDPSMGLVKSPVSNQPFGGRF